MLVFAMCLLIGGIGADNTLGTAIGRALVAMLVTYVVVLIVGYVAQRMLEENLKALRERKTKEIKEILERNSPPADR